MKAKNSQVIKQLAYVYIIKMTSIFGGEFLQGPWHQSLVTMTSEMIVFYTNILK